jgi:hypothetical protein
MTITTPAPVPSSSRARRSCGNACPAVRQHWGTPVAFATLDPAGLLSPAAARVGPDGPALQLVPAEEIFTDPAEATSRFRTTFDALTAEFGQDLAPPANRIDVEVQVWRHGYALPAAGHPADMVAWWVLDAGSAPERAEAGALTFADPRTGSPLTPIPGRPWGRHLLIRPVPGAHIAVPGWLASSVVPLEPGQHVLVAFASTGRTSPEG